LSETRTYLLDTNTVSDIMNGYSEAARLALLRESRSSIIAISSITSGELRFGIKKRNSKRLQRAFDQFLTVGTVLPWNDEVAMAYADLRDRLTRGGKTLDSLDMLIAAHAIAAGAVLVSRDSAFQHAREFVEVVNWATDLENK
jgi:tRNA(fMet)-specific endonuclease VapC